MSDLHPHCKLWISSDTSDGSFGTAKVRLLEAICQTGSLQEAARTLGISYRKAWADLQKAEACLQCQLVEKTRGGQGGGRTVVTDQGRRVIRAYSVMKGIVLQGLNQAFDGFVQEVKS
ncbi:MAG: LysR family transcriptional regulator [Phycisphaeraceae bacterium]|nr:LysR family transcriptional regulator [Phycisphaeraceae bacterium]